MLWRAAGALLVGAIGYLIVADWPADREVPRESATEALPVQPDRTGPAAPVLAPTVFVAAEPAALLKPTRTTLALEGRWVGGIALGEGILAPFSFTFRTSDGRLTGSARAPLGEAAISNGRFDGQRLSFTTQHRVPSSGQTVVSRFNGALSGDAIELDMDSDGARGIVRIHRISRDPGP